MESVCVRAPEHYIRYSMSALRAWFIIILHVLFTYETLFLQKMQMFKER